MYSFNFQYKKIRIIPTSVFYMLCILIRMRNYKKMKGVGGVLLDFHSLGYVVYIPERETTSSFS